MTADDKQQIEWQLKHLSDKAGELSVGELNLLISYEEQFKRNHKLSPRQMEVLESIYMKHR